MKILQEEPTSAEHGPDVLYDIGEHLKTFKTVFLTSVHLPRKIGKSGKVYGGQERH